MKTCDSCGEPGALSEYTDEGDPSTGYGPVTEKLCDGCAIGKGLMDEADAEAEERYEEWKEARA
jgi:hypothetical protein